jgi:hypothetical protein
LISLVPKKAKPAKRRAFYKSPPPPKPPKGRAALPRSQADRQVGPTNNDLPHAHSISPAHFSLREDGSIGAPNSDSARTTSSLQHADSEIGAPPSTPSLIFSSDTPFIRLYCGNCLELLDAIAAKYPDGRFDAIFADPPYFLPAGP